MKDIAKMRQEMEQKIKLAELSNAIEEQTGIECNAMGESYCQKGKQRIWFGEVTKEQAAKVLKMFPWTERSKTGGRNREDIEISYILSTEQRPKECRTKLSVEWIHGEYDMGLDIRIDPSDDVLMGYFKKDQYEIDDSTIGLYFGAVGTSERGELRYRPCLNFNCGSVVRYYGGHFKQVSEGHAECIVAEIIGE